MWFIQWAWRNHKWRWSSSICVDAAMGGGGDYGFLLWDEILNVVNCLEFVGVKLLNKFVK